MTSLEKPLLQNKGKSFGHLYEELVLKNQQLKKKNDHYQRINSDEMDSEMLEEVQEENKVITREIENMKDILAAMEDRFGDPRSKNKIKMIKSDSEKQIDRYKRIMENLLQKSFLRKRRSSSKNQQNSDDKFIVHRPTAKRTSTEISREFQQVEKFSQLDLELERKEMEERKVGIVEAEKQMTNINKILTDMNAEVHEHGEKLNIIDENVLEAKENVEAANEELDKASKNQKKSKKKCFGLVVLVIFLALIIGGIIFLLKK